MPNKSKNKSRILVQSLLALFIAPLALHCKSVVEGSKLASNSEDSSEAGEGGAGIEPKTKYDLRRFDFDNISQLAPLIDDVYSPRGQAEMKVRSDKLLESAKVVHENRDEELPIYTMDSKDRYYQLKNELEKINAVLSRGVSEEKVTQFEVRARDLTLTSNEFTRGDRRSQAPGEVSITEAELKEKLSETQVLKNEVDEYRMPMRKLRGHLEVVKAEVKETIGKMPRKLDEAVEDRLTDLYKIVIEASEKATSTLQSLENTAIKVEIADKQLRKATRRTSK